MEFHESYEWRFLKFTNVLRDSQSDCSTSLDTLDAHALKDNLKLSKLHASLRVA